MKIRANKCFTVLCLSTRKQLALTNLRMAITESKNVYLSYSVAFGLFRLVGVRLFTADVDDLHGILLARVLLCTFSDSAADTPEMTEKQINYDLI